MDFNQSFLSYDKLEEASCQLLFLVAVSQKDTAMGAVKHIAFRQSCDVYMSFFGRLAISEREGDV